MKSDQETLEKDAATIAMAFELAASFIQQFSSLNAASMALEAEALKLRRKWSRYPVAAPGEREYSSWRSHS